jgi:hypothetical protein
LFSLSLYFVFVFTKSFVVGPVLFLLGGGEGRQGGNSARKGEETGAGEWEGGATEDDYTLLLYDE